MNEPLSLRRMAENESVFRNHNERIKKNFDELLDMAHEAGQEYLLPADDTALHFYCECSDENCRRRILMRPSEYNQIHQNRRRFILITGHETDIIEKVVRRENDYSVVEKFKKPPESSRVLTPTGVDNS